MDNTATLTSRGAYLHELAVALDRSTNGIRGSHQFETAIKGFSIVRSEHQAQPVRRASGPAMYITVQGAECEVVGEKRNDSWHGQAFILSVEDRCRSIASLARPMHPYLGLVIELDRAYTLQVIEELGIRFKPASSNSGYGALILDLSPR